jgi:8-hydroxy-5-deazaflavin:NADPH oxidoreductase
MDEPLQVAVVGGTGNEGRGLALRLALTGASVTIGSRERSRAADVAGRLREGRGAIDLDGASNDEAVARADVVIIAVPFAHAGATVEACGSAFRPESLVVDVTVPLVFEGGRPRFVEPPEGSAAEHLRARLPGHVSLACAFKTVPARLLEHVDVPLDCDEFICGDSPEARERAERLVRRIPGLRPIDAGPLEAARVLERMTLLAISLNKRYKRHDARFHVLGV